MNTRINIYVTTIITIATAFGLEFIINV